MEKSKISKRKLKKRRKILKFLLFVMIIISIYLFAFKTDYFNITDIKVVGNKKMSYEQIVKASTCIKGENIFKINVTHSEESLKMLPYIKNCKVKRKLPNEIIIEIEERKDIAIISYLGSFAYIDEKGYILSIEGKKGKVSLPQIFGLKEINIRVGNNIFDTLEMSNIKEFIVYSDQLNILSSIKYINLSNYKNIMLELNDGIKVAFGPLDNVKYKLRFLYRILEDINKNDMHVKQILFNKGNSPIIVQDN
ncbi:FtsQ-type POTRA domain-containing protein [Schnuerera sp. xch1]|uniref:cell division protein FtsQ/DivIB n=1 Tax=Schnuerera sp. xch1 TaxID=2874283 RepID=UPI001CBC1364|nr:FtsQ-type POTRA domain-containing protein [Schnuerera sp. xch1]MBZ2173677.1 FtsQ-type POTRA domain-containing protein [Schnuerera sp. xch1]